MSFVLVNNQDKLGEIEEMYEKFSTIEADDDIHKEVMDSKSDLMCWLEGD